MKGAVSEPARAVLAEYSPLGGFSNRNLCLHCTIGWKSQTKETAGSLLGGSIPCGQMFVSSQYSHALLSAIYVLTAPSKTCLGMDWCTDQLDKTSSTFIISLETSPLSAAICRDTESYDFTGRMEDTIQPTVGSGPLVDGKAP